MDIDRLNILKEAQERFILEIEAKYTREAVQLQRRLLTALNEDLMSRLDITDGEIVNSQRNYNVIYEFDELWQNYSDSYFTPVIRNIATDALKVTALSDPYFKALGLTASGDVKLFAEATQNIESMMGIERKGKALSFTKGGYMDRLLLGADIKNDVMKVLTDNVSIGGGFKDLLVQMRETVTGSPQIDGTLQRYFRGYVYDTFSGVNAAYDNYIAGAAGMNYFVYEGTLIKTTREFCKTHLGLVFHRKDIPKFDAMEWAGKNTGVPFIIGRGGYNCRHQLQWIPDELVKDFGGKLQPQSKATQKSEISFKINDGYNGTFAEVKLPEGNYNLKLTPYRGLNNRREWKVLGNYPKDKYRISYEGGGDLHILKKGGALYNAGETVTHTAFGKGVITSVSDDMVTINFEKAGTKSLLKSIASNFLK